MILFHNGTCVIWTPWDQPKYPDYIYQGVPILNQAHAWFLKIDMVRTLVCVCVSVCPPPGLLKTIHVK